MPVNSFEPQLFFCAFSFTTEIHSLSLSRFSRQITLITLPFFTDAAEANLMVFRINNFDETRFLVCLLFTFGQFEGKSIFGNS